LITLPRGISLEKRANSRQQIRDIVLHHVLEEVRIYLVVGMDQDISGIDHPTPRDPRMFGPELLAQFIGCLADDLQVAANRIRRHLVLHPMRFGGDGVLQNPLGRVPDVKQVEYRIFHSPALERDRFGQDTVADIGVETSGFHQIDGRGQEVPKVRLKPAQIEQIPTGFEVHQKVDVAAGTAFVPRNRTEHTHVRRAMKTGQRQNGRPLFGLERLERHLPLLCIIAKAWGQNDDITVVTVRRNS
jgi:hypothetical protein